MTSDFFWSFIILKGTNFYIYWHIMLKFILVNFLTQRRSLMARFLDFLTYINFWEFCYQHTFAYRSGSTLRNVFFRWYLILCNTVWQEIKWVLFMCQLSFKSCLFSKNFLSTQNWNTMVIDKVLFNFEMGIWNWHFRVPGH